MISIGGPLSASAISDEINAAFETRLTDQRALIRVAREGGAFELQEDLGPSVGHGAELSTTPVSMVSSDGENTVVNGAPAMPRASEPEPQASSASGAVPSIATHVPVSARSSTMPVKPLPMTPSSSRAWIVLLAALAVGAGGAAVFFALRGSAGGSAIPTNNPVVATPPPDARSAVARVITPDAFEAVAEPVDAAVEIAIDAAPLDSGSPTRPDRPLPRPGPPASKPGPPGFITIDSSPVYAVVSIDGKSYGETPLVHIELSPGKHTLRAVSPSGTSRTLGITIESGKVAPTRRIEW